MSSRMMMMAAPSEMYMTVLYHIAASSYVRAEGFEPPVGFRRRIKSPIPSSSSVRPPSNAGVLSTPPAPSWDGAGVSPALPTGGLDGI